MAISRDKKTDELIFIGSCLVVFIPFLVFSAIKFFSLKKKYMSSENFHRVVDIGTLKRPLIICAGYIFTSFIILDRLGSKSDFLLIVCFIALFYVGIKMAHWVSVNYIGAIIEPNERMIYFPPDMKSFGISDYLSLKILKAMSNLEEVSLDSITKITRGYRKYLYLHGDFGSHEISFSNKQKRDECISLIQDALNKNVLLHELE